jgi:hypothetical protein
LAVATTSAFQQVATPVGSRAQRHAGHRIAHFQPDQVPALVQREVAAAGVGVGLVFLEAVADVLGLAFHRHPHAHADVVGDDLRPSVSSDEITSTMPFFSSTPPSLRGA